MFAELKFMRVFASFFAGLGCLQKSGKVRVRVQRAVRKAFAISISLFSGRRVRRKGFSLRDVQAVAVEHGYLVRLTNFLKEPHLN